MYTFIYINHPISFNKNHIISPSKLPGPISSRSAPRICAPTGQVVRDVSPTINTWTHEDSSKEFSNWWYTYPSEKYEFVSWDDDIPNIWKNKKCSKPPTRF
jgi:hypothetical protein